jgi:hypothetical protein
METTITESAIDALTEFELWTKQLGRGTLIHEAARIGFINSLPRAVLYNVANWQVADDRRRTALHVAAEFGTLSQVPPEIRTHAALMSQADSKVRTPLHVAAEEFMLRHVPADILECRELWTACDQWNYTPLHYAARDDRWSDTPRNQWSLVPESIRSDKELIGMRNLFGFTPADLL